MIAEILPLVVLALPVFAASACACLPRTRPGLAHGLAAAAMGVATLLAVVIAFEVVGRGEAVQGPHLTWLELGTFRFGVGTFVDPMGAIMMTIVCLLATLVLVFDAWYLHDDPLAARFPWQLCGFAAAMLGVVLADNLLLAFVCWGLVGLGACGCTWLGYHQALPAAVGGLAAMVIFGAKSIRLRRSAKKTTRSLDDVLQRSAAKLRDGAEKSAD